MLLRGIPSFLASFAPFARASLFSCMLLLLRPLRLRPAIAGLNLRKSMQNGRIQSDSIPAIPFPLSCLPAFLIQSQEFCPTPQTHGGREPPPRFGWIHSDRERASHLFLGVLCALRASIFILVHASSSAASAPPRLCVKSREIPSEWSDSVGFASPPLPSHLPSFLRSSFNPQDFTHLKPVAAASTPANLPPFRLDSLGFALISSFFRLAPPTPRQPRRSPPRTPIRNPQSAIRNSLGLPMSVPL